MRSSIFLVAAAVALVTATPAPQATSTPTGPFFLGSPCTSTSQCPNGSQCYAVNSMLIARCGGFQAGCTTDAQCATNSCNAGFCNGLVAPTLPLGTPCYESSQCAGGASCYAVNAMLVPSCGNFQAACVSTAQCAFNSCVNGLCGGLLGSGSPSSSPSSTTTAVVAPTTLRPTLTSSATMSLKTGLGTTTAPGNATVATSTRAPTPVFTGGASAELRVGLAGAVAAPMIAFALMGLV